MKTLQFVTILFSAGLLTAQTYVPPGEGTLSQAVADAVDGDILELVPEGVYTESAAYLFGNITDRSLTIRVEGEDPERAVLQILTPPDGITTVRFFEVGDNGSLTLQDLELDGTWGGAPNANHGVTFDVGEVPAMTRVPTIRVEGCYFHDLLDWGLSAGSTDMQGNLLIDSTFVDDTIFENVATSIYYKYCGANYIELTNSTVNTTTSYGFRVSGPVESGMPNNTPSTTIDHTTWYNIGTEDSREVIQCEKGPHLGQWVVTNSIFVKHINKDRTALNIKDTVLPAQVHHICLWDVGNRAWQDGSHNVTVSDTINVDPQFADPDNGDFKLPVGSVLLTFGSDGGPIGDPRWAGNASAVQGGPEKAPASFTLEQNYPNPFNPVTAIRFRVAVSGSANLTVFDLTGRIVAELVDGVLSAGPHTVTWVAGDLPSGIYTARLTSGGQTLTNKMTLLK